MIVSEPGVERQGRTTRHGACRPCSGYPHSSAGAAGLHLHLERVRQPGGPSIGVRGLPSPTRNGTDLPIIVPRPATLRLRQTGSRQGLDHACHETDFAV